MGYRAKVSERHRRDRGPLKREKSNNITGICLIVLTLVYLLLIAISFYDHKQECARYDITIKEMKETIENYETKEREMVSNGMTIDILRTKVNDLEQQLTEKQEQMKGSNIDIFNDEIVDQESEEYH